MLPSMPGSIKLAYVHRFTKLNFINLLPYACYMRLPSYSAGLSRTKSYKTTQNHTTNAY